MPTKKRSRRRRDDDDGGGNDTFKLLELQMGIMAHAKALQAVTDLLAQDKKQAAVARLDSAVTGLHALVRGQCAGMTMKCPHCESEQEVVAWVDDGKCSECGGVLEPPRIEDGGA